MRKQRKEVKETPHHGRRRTRWCLPPENKQDVKPEPVCIVQSDLSKQGSGTSFTFRYQLGRNTHLVSLLVSDVDGKFTSFYRNPREIKIQKFFTTLIRNTDSPTCKLFFNSGTFILTKLGSISLTEIVLKIVFVNNTKLQLHSYIAAKDFTPHKPPFRALFFARPRVTGNTKLDYCCRDVVEFVGIRPN